VDTEADLDGGFGRGLEVDNGARVDASRLYVARNRSAGIFAFGAGAEVTLADVISTGTRSQLSNGDFGEGIHARKGARVNVVRGLFVGNRDAALRATDPGSVMSLADVVVRETVARDSDQLFGVGIYVRDGAELTAERVLVEDNREAGIFARGSGTRVELTDAFVRRTRSRQSDGGLGEGLTVIGGASASVLRGVFAENQDTGVLGLGAGSELTLTDVVVRDTLGRGSDGGQGDGLIVLEGAAATVERGLFAENHHGGVSAYTAGAALVLRDVVVRDTRATASDQSVGIGIGAGETAQVDVKRTLVQGNRSVGIYVAEAGTRFTLSDGIVRETAIEEKSGLYGYGIQIRGGADATLDRAFLRTNAGVGVIVGEPDTHLSIRDLTARDGNDSGLVVLGAAACEVERGRFVRNLYAGVITAHAGSRVACKDVTVEGTRPFAAGPVDGEYGIGIGALSGAVLELANGRVAGNHVAGIFAQSSATLTISSVDIEGTLAGAFRLAAPDPSLPGMLITGVGDGVLITDGSSVTLSKVRISGSARAGVFLNGSRGTLSSTVASGGSFGLVVQQSPELTLDEATCDFSDNTTPTLSDGTLTVPDAPLPIPDLR
jgi:hypothetical protein